MSRRTHIPGADGRTYCGRRIEVRLKSDSLDPSRWSPPCIDMRTQCIEDATCTRCQRVDNRRQAETYRLEIGWCMFVAACRWAGRMACEELGYNPRRRAAYAIHNIDESAYNLIWRLHEDLRFDAEDER